MKIMPMRWIGASASSRCCTKTIRHALSLKPWKPCMSASAEMRALVVFCQCSVAAMTFWFAFISAAEVLPETAPFKISVISSQLNSAINSAMGCSSKASIMSMLICITPLSGREIWMLLPLRGISIHRGVCLNDLPASPASLDATTWPCELTTCKPW